MNWLQLRSTNVALIAGLIMLTVTSVIAGRLGAPTGLIEGAFVLLVIAGTLLATGLTRTMQPETFQMAGGDLGWLRTVAPVVMVYLGAVALRPQPLDATAAAAAGLLVVAIACAAPLRRMGVQGLGQFALKRYRSRLLCAYAALCTLMVAGGLVLLSGARAFSQLVTAFAIPPSWAIAMIGGLSAMLFLPGGMASLIVGATIFAAIALTGAVLPVALLSARNDPLVSEAIAATSAAAQAVTIAPVEVLGAAAMALYLGLVVAARKPGQARQTFAWAALIVMVASAMLAFDGRAVSLATARLAGQPVDRLPAAMYAPASRGLVTICGMAPADPAELRRACAARGVTGAVPASEIRVEDRNSRWLATSLDLPSVVGVLHGLVVPLALVMLMAAAIRAAASALIDELLHASARLIVTSSARLALNRATGLAMIAGGLWCIGQPSVLDALLSWLWTLAPLLAVPLLVLPAALILPASAATSARWPAGFIALSLAAAALFAARYAPPLLAEGWLVVIFWLAAALLPLLATSRPVTDSPAVNA